MKLTSKIKSTVVAAMAALTLSTVAHAQLLTNGDFSANASSFTTVPGYTGGSNPASITGWDTFTKTDTNSIGLNGSGTGGAGSAFAPTGSSPAVFAFVQNDSGSGLNSGTMLTQSNISVSSTLSYVLTFDAAERGTVGNADPGTFTVTFGGQTRTIDNISKTSFGTYTFTFSGLSDGDADLTFTNLGTDTQDTTLDLANVSLEAVPEPSSYALGLLVVGVLAFEIRRRRAMVA